MDDDGHAARFLKGAGGTQADREVLASKINDALGIDLVPKTVFREHYGIAGSVQLDAGKKAQMWGEARRSPLGVKVSREQKFELSILDALLGNGDRHAGNLMYTRATKRIAAIDNGLTMMAPGARRRQDISASWWGGFLEQTAMTSAEQSLWLSRLSNPELDELIDSARLSLSVKRAALERLAKLRKAIKNGDWKALEEYFKVGFDGPAQPRRLAK